MLFEELQISDVQPTHQFISFLSKYITLWCTKALFNTKSKNNAKLKKIILS